MCLKTKLKATVGRGVKRVYLNENGDLIFVMTDGQTLNLGPVRDNLLPVHFTKEEDGSYTADKTYEEICVAHKGGAYVVAYDGVLFAPLTYMMEGKGVMFTSVYPPIFPDEITYEISVQSYMISANNTVSVRNERCSFLFAANESTDEMIMVSHNGAWFMEPMPKVEMDDTQLTEAVEAALTEAKESGQFDGTDGKDGEDGADGVTPVKGVDYYTEEEQTQLVNDVIEALGIVYTKALDFSNWTGGSFVETLSDGSTVTHEVKYDAYGTITSVGGIAVSGVV